MFGWIEIHLFATPSILVVLRNLPYFRSYRPLCDGACVLLLITALFPRTGNPVGEFFFGAKAGGLHLPLELFGVIWWILIAWLFKSLLQLALSRWFFPDNNEPHARRLFADLASGLIYVLAFFGIVGTVFHQPVSAFLATSGVLAIVLGLALQNTLGDVLAGLAINIEHPFRAGDWITLPDQVCGQVMQVNWRATRLRTWSHDMVVVPNSLVSKSIVRNHSFPKGPHRCIIALNVDVTVAPSRVIEALKMAATGSPGIAHGTVPLAHACGFSDGLVGYELAFAIDSFAAVHEAKSEMLERIATTFSRLAIGIGTPALAVRIVTQSDAGVANAKPSTVVRATM